jgi:ribonuclease PH
MLPHSTSPRKSRERDGKTDGRTTEIQRLIGRSMRAVVDLAALGEKSVTVDCDVLQADGGTRTAAITGGFIALADAIASAFPNCIPPGISSGLADGSSAVPVSGDWGGPIKDSIAAVSVGVVDGINYLDLDYRLDSQADVDMNVVMTGSDGLVEVQGTAEGTPFPRADLNSLLDLAGIGMTHLRAAQQAAIDAA